MKFQEKLMQYKTYIIAITIILSLIGFNIYTLTKIQYSGEEENIIEEEKTNNTKQEKTKIKVDIKGEINAAGVYELDKDSRVIDVINKAGGITKQGDTSLINLSKKLTDEMVIIIYSHSEVNQLKEGSAPKDNVCPKENNGCTTESLELITEVQNEQNEVKKETKEEKISINTASIEELQSLNGIGESKAKAIIKYREANGEFKKIEDIKNVTGIGDNAYEKIKDYITT